MISSCVSDAVKLRFNVLFGSLNFIAFSIRLYKIVEKSLNGKFSFRLLSMLKLTSALISCKTSLNSLTAFLAYFATEKTTFF
jgi:hypothetical protein